MEGQLDESTLRIWASVEVEVAPKRRGTRAIILDESVVLRVVCSCRCQLGKQAKENWNSHDEQTNESTNKQQQQMNEQMEVNQ